MITINILHQLHLNSYFWPFTNTTDSDYTFNEWPTTCGAHTTAQPPTMPYNISLAPHTVSHMHSQQYDVNRSDN